MNNLSNLDAHEAGHVLSRHNIKIP